MNRCPSCGSELKPCFSSLKCGAECDLRAPEEAKTRHTFDNMWPLIVEGRRAKIVAFRPDLAPGTYKNENVLGTVLWLVPTPQPGYFNLFWEAKGDVKNYSISYLAEEWCEKLSLEGGYEKLLFELA